MAVFQCYYHFRGPPRHKPKARPHSLQASATTFKVTGRSRDAPEFNFRPHTEDYFPSGSAALGATPSATPLALLRLPGPERAGGAWPRRNSRCGSGRLTERVHAEARSERAGEHARALPPPSTVTCLAEAALGRWSCYRAAVMASEALAEESRPRCL